MKKGSSPPRKPGVVRGVGPVLSTVTSRNGLMKRQPTPTFRWGLLWHVVAL